MTPSLNAFDDATSIITHPGQAHRDELLGVMFALAVNPQLSVYRVQPTQANLDDPRVVVIDVGGKYDTALLNFDHHQFPRDADPTCALTLVLERLNLLAAAKKAFAWLEFTEVLDSRGPVAAAKFLGTSVDKFMTTLSPVEASVLRLFEQAGDRGIAPGEPLHTLLVQMGVEKLSYVKRFGERIVTLSRNAKLLTVDSGDGKVLEVVDVRFIDRNDDPTLGLESWVKDNVPAAAVTITQDDRGDGLTVFRRNDHPRIDFSVLEGKVGTVFAHKNGFVAKLALGMDPLVAVRQALRPA